MARSKAPSSGKSSKSKTSSSSAGSASASGDFSPAFVGTFYPADVDGSPAAFVVDLEQEPRSTHPTRITVSVPMLEPEPDGLRSEGEMQDLDTLQTKLTERLARAAGADCVGFYDLRGVATFVFYAKKPITAAEATVAIGDTHPYEADVLVDEDPEWRFYIDALFPDAYALQGIWNRLIVDELESHGDQLYEPRDVDHVATFPSSAAAQKAAKKLAAAHFTIDGTGKADEDGRFEVAFHRPETLEEGKPDIFSSEILDIVLPLDGEYDGWGAPAVGPAAKKKAAKKAAKPAAKKKAAKPAAKKKAAKPAAKTRRRRPRSPPRRRRPRRPRRSGREEEAREARREEEGGQEAPLSARARCRRVLMRKTGITYARHREERRRTGHPAHRPRDLTERERGAQRGAARRSAHTQASARARRCRSAGSGAIPRARTKSDPGRPPTAARVARGRAAAATSASPIRRRRSSHRSAASASSAALAIARTRPSTGSRRAEACTRSATRSGRSIGSATARATARRFRPGRPCAC